MIHIPIDNARKITELAELKAVPEDGLFIVHDGTGVKSISIDTLTDYKNRYCEASLNVGIGDTTGGVASEFLQLNVIKNQGSLYELNDKKLQINQTGLYLMTFTAKATLNTKNVNVFVAQKNESGIAHLTTVPANWESYISGSAIFTVDYINGISNVVVPQVRRSETTKYKFENLLVKVMKLI